MTFPTLKTPFRKTAFFAFAMLLAQSVSANLVQDGTFTTVSYSGSAPLTAPYFGQIGPDTGTSPPASGATLTVANWTTNGYNFVFSASNVDQGTQTGGANAGFPVEVKNHRKAGEVTFELWQQMPEPIQAGDTFTVTAGCDKQFSTCHDRFNNVVNYRGFPHIPGNDFVIRYPVHGEPGNDGSSMQG